jgi:cytochrome c oxidase cbb3-type subunit 3
LAKSAASVDENTAVALTDAASLAAGKDIFLTYCKACHGETAGGYEGSVGPNLTDRFWIHGGGMKNVFSSIKYGWPEKGMQSWKKDLKPVEIHQVASFILSLQGSNPPNAKAPQGEEWKDVSPVDSTAAKPADGPVALAY